jgi:hypothetical protein
MKNIRVVSPGGSFESIADMARSAYEQEGTAAGFWPGDRPNSTTAGAPEIITIGKQVSYVTRYRVFKGGRA